MVIKNPHIHGSLFSNFSDKKWFFHQIEICFEMMFFSFFAIFSGSIPPFFRIFAGEFLILWKCEFVFTLKGEYGLGAKWSEANQNRLKFPVWCPRWESNPHRLVRSEKFYPLNYGGVQPDYIGYFTSSKLFVICERKTLLFLPNSGILSAMSPDEKELLEKTYRLSVENNTILRKMRRKEQLNSLFRWVYWIIIIILAYVSYIAITPYLQQLQELTGQIGGAKSSYQELLDNFRQ